MWALYRIATLLLGPVWLLFLRLRHGGTLAQRLGFWPERDDAPLWIQAVSVGEVRIAVRLAAALRERGFAVVLSATTETGLRLAREQGETPLPFPADLPGVAGRLLRRVRPRLVLLVETELWPGLLRAAAERKVPVLVANARLSDRSLGRTLRFSGAFGPALRALQAAAQSEEQAARFVRLGLPAERVKVCGNLKYDLEPPAAFEAQLRALRELCGSGGPLWVAGSVREGEEAPVLEAHRLLRERLPAARLLFAPRHLNRVDRTLSEAGRLGLRAVRRTGAGAGEPWDVHVLDTMGELQAAYACGAAAFVGGSLVPLGGQNLLEPAAQGVPVLFGPSMENFKEEAERLLASGGARRIAGPADLAAGLGELLADPERAAAVGRKGRAAVESYRGALERTLAWVEASVPPPRVGSV